MTPFLFRSGPRLAPFASFAPLLLAAFCMNACGPGAHEPGVDWRGKPMPVSARTVRPDAEMLRGAGLSALVHRAPDRILALAPGEWGDSLRLLEYSTSERAYAAFQELASRAEDVAPGISACGDRMCFRRGRWVGVLDAWSWRGGGVFDEALALPGGALPGEIPPAFQALLHAGRVPGSERILTGFFLGLPISVPVYAAKIECRGDTAWIYASSALRRSFADSLTQTMPWRIDTLSIGYRYESAFSALLPVTLLFPRRGMVGVEGCFDEKLTSEWLKAQRSGLKGLK